MTCPNCAADLPSGAKFCTACGASVPQTPPPDGQLPQTPPQQPPVFSRPMADNPFIEKSSPLTTGQYLLMFILTVIPVVNIIMAFVWAFGSADPSKRSFGRALLILFVILVLLLIFSSLAGVSLLSDLFYW